MQAMVQCHAVNYHYDRETMVFDFSVFPNEQVTIIGASGAGKSTLFQLLAGFITPDSGEIILNGETMRNVPPAKRPVSMLFQENNLFSHLTVAQNIGLGIAPSLTLSKTAQQQVNAMAECVGLVDRLDRYPAMLSGGQQQRVALARCLVQRRPILLLDEPFSALDPALREEMAQLVERIRQSFHLTVLMTSHHYSALLDSDQRCIALDHGRIVYDGAFSQLPSPFDYR